MAVSESHERIKIIQMSSVKYLEKKQGKLVDTICSYLAKTKDIPQVVELVHKICEIERELTLLEEQP